MNLALVRSQRQFHSVGRRPQTPHHDGPSEYAICRRPQAVRPPTPFRPNNQPPQQTFLLEVDDKRSSQQKTTTTTLAAEVAIANHRIEKCKGCNHSA